MESVHSDHRLLSDQMRRLQLSRRREVAGRNLLIFQFEGVLGELLPYTHSKNSVVAGPTHSLFFRHGLKRTLQQLEKTFQLVVVFSSITSERYLKHIMAALQDRDIIVDGLYAHAPRDAKARHDMADYAQIFYDFSLSIEEKQIENNVLMILPINLDNEEIKCREGVKIIKDTGESAYHIERLPLPHSGDDSWTGIAPPTLLVPH